MVSRRVLLHIFQRRKRILLEEDTGRPDVELLHEEFRKICQQDSWIAKQVASSDFVFQHYDSTFEVNVDIDNETVIADKTQVYLVILSVINEVVNPQSKSSAIAQICDQSTSCSLSETDEYNTTTNGDEPTLIPKDQCPSPVQIITPTLIEAFPSTVPSYNPNEKLIANTNIRNDTEIFRKAVIPFPSPLPNFSTEITERHKRGELMLVYKKFVRECAFFLLSLTATPSKADYRNYSRSVGESYPSIKDCHGLLVSFNMQLTRCVRNIRQRQKHFVKFRLQKQKSICVRKRNYSAACNPSHSTVAPQIHDTQELEPPSQICSRMLVPKFSNDESHVSADRYELRRTKGSNKCYAQVVPYPSPLPKFSAEIECRHKRGELLVEYRRFVRECAIFLLSLTATPSKADYRNFCRTVGEEYPLVKDCNGLLVSFNLQLTKCVRNLRQRQKNCLKYAPQTAEDISVARSRFHYASSSDASNLSAAEINNFEELKTELQQCWLNKMQPYSASDMEHISLLLNETFELRRQEVKDANSCAEVLECYPQLKQHFWFLQEANRVLVTPVEHRELRFQLIMARLQEVSQMEEPQDAKYCDEHHIRLLMWLSKKLKPKEDVQPIVLQKDTNPMDFTCDPTSSPFAKVYASEDGKISCAFILGEGVVIVDLIDKTNAFEVIDALMSSYYVYKRVYPAGYRDFLKFLQQEFLGLTLSRKEMANATKLTTFLKMYNTT